MFAEEAVIPARVADGVALTGPVPGGLVGLERLPSLAQRLTRPGLELQRPAQAQPGVGLPGAVAEPLVHPQGQAQMGVRVREGAETGQGVAQITMDAGLPGQVTGPFGGGQGDVQDRLPLLPVTAAVQVASQDPAQLPGQDVQSGLRRQAGGRGHDRALLNEPGQCRSAGCVPLRLHAVPWRGQGEQIPARAQRPDRCLRRVQVVVQHPAESGVPLRRAVG